MAAIFFLEHGFHKLETGATPELYNLKSDPGETNNVADKNPDVIKKFESLLKNQ